MPSPTRPAGAGETRQARRLLYLIGVRDALASLPAAGGGRPAPGSESSYYHYGAPEVSPIHPVEEVLADLAADAAMSTRIRAWERFPATAPGYAPFPPWLDERIAATLRGRGIGALYTHQADAVSAARAGRHVLVVTPTASGKSICYHLPVLQAGREHTGSTALYLFPTRALARDQAAELGALWRSANGAEPPPVHVYDGDTPGTDRPRIRREAAVVITNPDMVHTALLPFHPLWTRFWRGLRHVVVDEAHVYRGVEAAHLANVVRRLRRVCAHYGSRPVFIVCSATMGDPEGFARRLLGVDDLNLVDRNGAPRGARDFLLVEPPNRPEAEVRTAGDIALRFLRLAVPTIVFARKRNTCEQLATGLRDALVGKAGSPGIGAGAVAAYRGGLLPAERRALEAGLRDGRILGVVATSALEVGIDVGRLEAAVICGYPGSIASVWQQAGRAGRSGRPAAAILVCGGNPVDRFLARHPAALIAAPPEASRFDPDHPAILEGHLACACAELPVGPDETFGAGAEAALRRLQARGLVRLGPHGWHWIGRGRPATAIHLRAGPADRVEITDVCGRTVGDAALGPAALRLAPGALYLHGGHRYRVLDLDPETRVARVESLPANEDAPSLPHPRPEVTAVRLVAHRRIPPPVGRDPRHPTWAEAAWGRAALRVRSQCPGPGPALEKRVDACWLWLTPAAVLHLPPPAVATALRGLAGALHTAAAFHLQCDRRDIAQAVQAAAPPDRRPTIVFYENTEGMGLGEGVFDLLNRLLAGAARLIAGCPCPDGCLACVGAAAGLGGCPVGIHPKAAALSLLGVVTDRGGGRP